MKTNSWYNCWWHQRVEALTYTDDSTFSCANCFKMFEKLKLGSTTLAILGTYGRCVVDFVA